MNLIHLMSLAGPGKPPFEAPGPLFVPSWFSSDDQEGTVAYHHRLVEHRSPRRVDIVWSGPTLSDAQRDFLARLRTHFGAHGVFLAIHLSDPGVLVADALREPVLRAFADVAFTCDHPRPDEDWRTLHALCAYAQERAEEAFAEYATVFGVDPDPRLLDDLLHTAHAPRHRAGLFSVLLWAQLEREPWDRPAFVGAWVSAQFDELPAPTAIALIGLATARTDDATALLGEDEAQRQTGALRHRMLLRDGRLAGWARWLPDVLPALIAPAPTQLAPPWADAVRTAYGWLHPRASQ